MINYMTIKKLKSLTKEEFLKFPDATEWLYKCLQESKSGYIHIWKEDHSIDKKGHTEAFGEGISVQLDNMTEWYRTSVIQKINWDEKYFDTMNSRYYFDFTEELPTSE